MKRRGILIFIVILLDLGACKKDALEGDYTIFVGKWRWTHSKERTQYATIPLVEYDTLYASDYPDVYELEFFEKGKVRLIKNNELIEEYRTVVALFNYYGTYGNWNSTYQFNIQLNNKPDHFMSGIINSDNLRLSYKLFPLENYYDGANEVTYDHFFVKQ